MNRYLLLLALLSSGVSAQGQPESALFGVGVRNRPHYDGSERQTTDLVPVVRYSEGPWFARTTHGVLEGGARLSLGAGLHAGVQVAHEAGPRDGDPGASLGGHVEWTGRAGPAPVNVLGRLRNHADSERGRQLDARLTIGAYQGYGLRAGVFGQVSLASARHQQTYYGLRDSGLLFTSLGVLGSYDLSSRWLAVGSAEIRRLADGSARSPIVRDRTNHYVTLGVAYRY